MTCIVGVQHGRRVWLGGDSASICGSGFVLRRDLKVFQRDGYVIGFAASWRMGQVLQHAAELPDPHRVNRNELDAFMVTQFVPAIRGALINGGVIEGVDDLPGPLLVGVRGVLFNIDRDYQTCRTRDDYMAIGSGDDLALGSLHTTHRDRSWRSPGERVRLALEAAAHHSTGVAAPFTVVAA